MNNFDLKSYLAERRELVEKALAEFLPPADDYGRNLLEAMRYSLFAGGKRLRPILCLAGCEAVGGSLEQAMPAAVALEMIHTYSLIHDDLPGMDDDDLRRGRPTNHKVFGVGMAVLAGDGLLNEGLGLLAMAAVSGRIDPVRAMAALDVIARAAGHRGMVGGQAMDIESEGRAVDGGVLEYIHTHKTGALLIASVKSGAILGGGDPERVAALEAYGRGIGLAFQIVDDILDIEGDTASLGKTVGADQARGKATYPAVYGLDAAKAEARRLIGEALAALNGFGGEAAPLRAIADYLLTRKK